MARLWKTLPAFLLALVLAVAVACGGGGNDDATSNQDSTGGDAPSAANTDGDGDSSDVVSNDGDGGSLNGAPGDLLVSNATEVLGASAESFSEDITSMRAEFVMSVESADMTVGASGDFAFKSPDQVYMTMDIDSDDSALIDLGELGTFEVLVLGNEFYVNIPLLGGWFVMSGEDVVGDFGDFDSLLEGHSPFDYQMLIDALGDSVEDLGEESVDGGIYHHYQVTVDAQDVYDAFAEAFGESETLGIEDVPTDALSGPMVMDIWVYADSFLPYKLEASASFVEFGQTTDMTFSMKFTDYNVDFDMPDPPDDAQSFDEFFGAFFEDSFSIDVEQQ